MEEANTIIKKVSKSSGKDRTKRLELWRAEVITFAVTSIIFFVGLCKSSVAPESASLIGMQIFIELAWFSQWSLYLWEKLDQDVVEDV